MRRSPGGGVVRPRPQRQERILTTRVGLQLPVVLRYDRWERAGQHLFQIADSSAWCLGDWLVYGQERYADRYQAGVEAAGLDYQTLRNYAWVTRRFEYWRRRESLSFGHHAEVASLPPAEADAWLDRSEQHRWSRNQLRINLRESRRGKRAVASPERTRLPRISASGDRMGVWREAASKADREFDEWILSALDRAAAHELGR
ncbi:MULTISPECIES: LmbU family transcriptional regulator [unclassified Streptomyces]|uniref:LmbU family transcriptional regulator n=1 Tax=unclassified Streptomyces TaxID=2593676 RepID=UPI001CE2BF73|nr:MULTISPECIES: LmbU family transcriptional regulator [unclassified Streptomyces]UCA50583.1 LmbU family transcriptional regulator [Streptomyces sp. WA6-1-16]